jgi:hypothetical protein
MTTLSMTRGDDRTLDLAVTFDGAPVDLSGAQLWWTAKMRHLDTDADAVIRKSSADGITVVDAAGGLATVAIKPEDTATLPGSNALWWDLQVKSGGLVHTIAKGRLVVNADVTRTA